MDLITSCLDWPNGSRSNILVDICSQKGSDVFGKGHCLGEPVFFQHAGQLNDTVVTLYNVVKTGAMKEDSWYLHLDELSKCFGSQNPQIGDLGYIHDVMLWPRWILVCRWISRHVCRVCSRHLVTCNPIVWSQLCSALHSCWHSIIPNCCGHAWKASASWLPSVDYCRISLSTTVATGVATSSSWQPQLCTACSSPCCNLLERLWTFIGVCSWSHARLEHTILSSWVCHIDGMSYISKGASPSSHVAIKA